MPTEAQLKRKLCWAGRWAFLQGAWKTPCPLPPLHVIASPGLAVPIRLCDPHFQEANEAGHVTEPYLDPEEYRRRRRAEGLEP